MSKEAKRRMCPAVGHEISRAECGENRGSKYACPADCQYNPFAPENYDSLLAIEKNLDTRSMKWLFDEAEERSERLRAFEQANRSSSVHALHAFFEWHLFFKQGADGLTSAQRWERAGFPGLKNDEQVLLRGKMQTRIGLLEAHRVLDTQRTEMVDLLAPGSAPLLIMDRSLAAAAARFACFVAWTYPLPHFWRLAGTTILLPEMDFEPAEIVSELARHLGGPAAGPALRLWLAEHFVRFDEAVLATTQAREQQMFAGIDAQYGKAIYELQAPLAECRAALDASPEVEAESPAPQEEEEGFTEERVWFAEPDRVSRVVAPTGRPILGRVLLGPTHWRLEAMGRERFATLRQKFEAQLGPRVKFAGERRDDMAKQMLLKEPGYNASLVPPRLLGEPPQIVLTSAQVAPRPPRQSRQQAEAELMLAQDRAFLDDHIPVLDGRTPREAARDPALRPKLVRLLKARVRAHDERNLRTGRTDDINWMLRELGMDELLFDAPPKRAPFPREEDGPEEEESEENWDLPAPPPLPPEPLGIREAGERLHAAVEAFETAAEALAELEASGVTILEDISKLAQTHLNQKELNLLATFVLQAWFALVPPGSRPPAISIEELEDAYRRALEKMSEAVKHPPEQMAKILFEGCRQPFLVQLLMHEVVGGAKELPKAERPRPESELLIIAWLRAVVEVLDRALRRQQ